jgi:phosphomannomutase
LHYGRDALVGIALTLQHLLEENCTITELKNKLPQYFISKKRIDLINANPDNIISAIAKKYSKEKINTEDGLRIDFPDHWVHFRKSNTEPIIRIITEAKDQIIADNLAEKYYNEIKSFF